MMKVGRIWLLLQVMTVCSIHADAQLRTRLSIKIEQAQNGVPNDRTVKIRAEIKNISSHDVQLAIVLGALTDDLAFIVIGPDGHPAARLKPSDSRTMASNPSSVIGTLPPQQVVERLVTLSDSVDFSRPGAYRITVSSHFKSVDETDVSNTIELTVP